jgi:hypothetical protein
MDGASIRNTGQLLVLACLESLYFLLEKAGIMNIWLL